MSSYVFSLHTDGSVGGLWYWSLRCWDDDVQDQQTLASGSVKAGFDPQVSLNDALDDCRHDLEVMIKDRWVLFT